MTTQARPAPMRRQVTAQQYAAVTHMPLRTVQKLCKRGELPATQDNGRWYILAEVAEADADREAKAREIMRKLAELQVLVAEYVGE